MAPSRKKKAVVLLSGGLDSATVLYWAISREWQPSALAFDYGQRHRREMASARALCRLAGVPLHVIRFPLPWKGSSLLNQRSRLPLSKSHRSIGRSIPSTYVPARNTIFLAFGLSCAEAIGAGAVMIGANALDYSGYPDCRPDYIQAFGRVFKLGTKAGREGRAIRIIAPLIKYSKAEIVRLGSKLGVPWELTWSCYRGGDRPCGRCDSCRLRARGFKEARVSDPLIKPTFSKEKSDEP
jgi:7-cyano-7-deazaguanine synthase